MTAPTLTFHPAPGSPCRVVADVADVNDGRVVTVLRDIRHRPQGKRFDLVDGRVEKNLSTHTGEYWARSIHVPTLTTLAELVAGLGPDEILILGCIPGAGFEPYRITPQKWLRSQLGLPDDVRPSGLHTIGGVRYAARLKENFTSCRYLLIDRDPGGAPPDVAGLSDDDYLRLIDRALPGIAAAERVVFPSSSGRIAYPDGRAALSAGMSSHTYIECAGDAWADLDDLRLRSEAAGWAAGLGYTVIAKGGATLKRLPWDTSVFSICREVFESAPDVGPGLVVLPRTWTYSPGGQCPAPPLLTPESTAAFKRETGATIQHGRAVAVDQTHALQLATRIETQRYGILTIAEYLKRNGGRTRCQTPFRDSSSWNGILGRTKTGGVYFHDNGLRQSYFLSADDAADDAESDAPGAAGPESAAEQKRPVLSSPRRLETDLVVLEARPRVGLALIILKRHFKDSPRKRDTRELVDSIISVCPAAQCQIEACALRLGNERKAAALRLSGCTEQGVTLPSLTGLVASLRSGCHVIKAPMDSGKTQSVLAPLAKHSDRVVAICHRQSLARDLAERLGIPCYLNIRGDEVVPTDLSICVNSIVSGGYSTALDGCKVLLIDEASQVLRAIWNAGAVDRPGQVYERLKTLVQQADLVVAVDADLNDAALAVFRSWRSDTTFWRMDKPAGKTLTFGDINAGWAAIQDAVQRNAKLVIPTDSLTECEALATSPMFAGRRVLVIHGDNVGSAPVQIALANINQAATEYDTIIYSPTLASGLSLNVPGFETIALYFGVVCPSDFLQMVARNRPAQEIIIGCKGHGFHTRPVSEAALWQGCLAVKTKQEQIAAIHLTDDEALPVFAWSDYDAKRVASLSLENEARSDCYGHLLILAESLGYTVTRIDEPGHTAPRKEARADAAAAHVDRVITAPLIDEETADAIRDGQKKRTQQNADALYQFDARHWLGIGGDRPLTPCEVIRFDRGAFIPKAKAFEALTSKPAELLAADWKERGAGREGSRLNNRLVQQRLYRDLLICAGVDPETGQGEMTAATAADAWDHWNSQRALVLGLRLGTLPEHRPKPALAMRWLGEQLDRLGLETEGKRVGIDGKRVWTYQITGWADMAAGQINRKSLSNTVSSIHPASPWIPEPTMEATL